MKNWRNFRQVFTFLAVTSRALAGNTLTKRQKGSFWEVFEEEKNQNKISDLPDCASKALIQPRSPRVHWQRLKLFILPRLTKMFVENGKKYIPRKKTMENIFMKKLMSFVMDLSDTVWMLRWSRPGAADRFLDWVSTH